MPLLASDIGRSLERVAPTKRLRNGLIRGLAIAIPFIITVLLLHFAVNFVFNSVGPIVTLVEGALGTENVDPFLMKGLILLVILTVITLIGLAAESGSDNGSIEETFDEFMSNLPGIGSIYTSFNEMSEMLLRSDTQSFREVKLVEFPHDGTYAIAFKTAETSEEIETAAGHPDMETVYLPMAPNPVMGGFVLHIDSERVLEVDMSVQEGMQSIVTSGVAVGSPAEGSGGSDSSPTMP